MLSRDFLSEMLRAGADLILDRFFGLTFAVTFGRRLIFQCAFDFLGFPSQWPQACHQNGKTSNRTENRTDQCRNATFDQPLDRFFDAGADAALDGIHRLFQALSCDMGNSRTKPAQSIAGACQWLDDRRYEIAIVEHL